MKRIAITLIFSLLCLMLSTGSAISAGLNLSVAASLKGAVTELSDTFAKKNPGVSFQRNFAASGALAKQIANGAPCDVYFSANVQWTDYLKEKKLIVDS